MNIKEFIRKGVKLMKALTGSEVNINNILLINISIGNKVEEK
jgi:hypothetical protein